MVLLICVALVNNILPITLKVSALANVSLNMITLCAVTCCILNRRLGLSKPLPALAIVALSGPKLQFLPPLSNTLFLIHPVLLYVSAVRSVITTGGFLSHGLCKSAPLLLLGLAMGLGGYWSLQELSWGGWWNWDVLECGIAYIWAIAVGFTHLRSSRTMFASTAHSAWLAALFLTYVSLNKVGLGTSIHSFVSSATVRQQFHFILLTCVVAGVMTWDPKWSRFSLLFLPMTLSYFFLKEAFFAKVAVAVTPLLMYLSLNRFGPWRYAIHSTILYTAALVLSVNFCNMSYTTSVSDQVKLWALNFNYMPSISLLRSECRPFVWKGIWLAKPSYSSGFGLLGDLSRTQGAQAVITVFFK